MLEITMSEPEKFLLERAGFKNVISFSILLSFGKIKNITEKKIHKLTVNIQQEIEKLNQIKNKQIRIWYSSNDNEDVCTLYYLLSWFYEKEIEIFLLDVADTDHFSLACYDKTNPIPTYKNKTNQKTRYGSIY